MSVIRRLPDLSEASERIVQLFIVCAAVWAVYGQAMVLVRASFAALAGLAPLAGACALGIAWWLAVRSREPPPMVDAQDEARRPRFGSWERLLGGLMSVLAYVATGSYVVFWIGATLLLSLAAWDGPAEAAPRGSAEQEDERSAMRPVIALMVLAMVLTLVAHRPDPDDAFYLNLVVSSLDHPEAPPLEQDRMFGEIGLPLLSPVYRLQTYELAVAVASWWTGIAPKTVYYLLFPALSAGLAILASWLALRALSGRRSVLALVVGFVALLTWGDAHAGYANLSFVRLFQGKAVLVAVAVPAIAYAAMRFVKRRDLTSWLLLSAAQVGAVGISASGVFVAPAVAAPLVLAAARPSRADVRTVGLGLLASLPLLLLGAWLATQSESLRALVPEPRTAYGTGQNLLRVIGRGMRGELALLALVAVPAIPLPRGKARLLIAYALAIMVIFLNPLTSDLLAHVARSMDWRIFWAIPFPLLLGLVVDGISRLGPMMGRVNCGAIAAALFAAAFVLAPGHWTVSAANGLWLGLPGYKVPPAYAVAEELARATPRGGVVVAPWRIAAWMATLPDHPRLNEVRPHYLRLVAHARGPVEASRRRLLQRAVDTRRTSETWLPAGFAVESHLSEVMQEIDSRGVTTVVMGKRLPWRGALAKRLAAAGFQMREIDAYQLWLRDQPARPAA